VTGKRRAGRHTSPSKGEAVIWLWGHLRKFPFIFAFFVISIFVSVFLQTISSVYIGRVFDTLGSDAGRSVFIQAVLIVLGLLGTGALIQWISSLSILSLRLKLEKEIRKEIYSSFLNKTQAFANTARTGDLLAIGTNELRNISVMLQPGLNMSLRSLVSYIFPLGMIVAYYAWELWILPVAAMVVSIPLLFRYANRITDTTSSVRESFAQLNADLNETIEGIEVIKSQVQEEREIEKFETNVRTYAERSWVRALVEVRFLPSLIFHALFTVGLLQCLMLYRIDELTVGQVVAYLGLFLATGSPIGNAEITFGFLGTGLASGGRILNAVRSGVAGDQGRQGGQSKAAMIGSIEFDRVSFQSATGQRVLNEITFQARAGETIAIVGATGSGKSLLARCLNHSFEPTEGSIRIDGVDIREWSLERLRSQIGVVEQDVFLFSWSVRDNIAFGRPDMSDEEVKHYAVLAGAHEFIENLEHGYETRIGERGIHLSGGQRQRIALARALASEPKMLILDDSTSGLDSETEREIMNNIRNVQKGRTLLIITNRLSAIRQADRIVLLNRGNVVAQGSHEELATNSALYRDLFALKEVI